MIEQSHRKLIASPYGDLDTLQQRVNHRRSRHRQALRTLDLWLKQLRAACGSPARSIRRLPSRFLLHTIVALVLPLAVVLSYVPAGTLTALPEQAAAPGQSSGDLVAPVVPFSLDTHTHVGDAPLSETDDIPVPLSLISRSEALAPIVVPGMLRGEGRISIRNGPGTEYDVVARMAPGVELQVVGRYGDWFQVRESAEKPTFWVSGELLDIPEAASFTLFEIQEQDLPAPPPPKVGTVAESGLLLRDGPGTNYVPMTSLEAGTQLELIETYQDWFHVGVPNGGSGWVSRQFMQVEPSILDRLLEAETIPDPNPALVGMIRENQVNLRKGPDSRYARLGQINAGVQVDLIGKYNDWFKVQLPDGTKAWVFADLINTTAHVVRRVPVTKDFPALPTRARTNSSSGASANLADIPASGDVASYAVQFVGSRYVWGGASPRTGFDCSGLTSYVYRQFGVNLPHHAASQFSTRYGASVGSMENLAPGDLVFFVNTGGGRGITHVAIYIGGGRIVHAMTPRYGVQVSNVWDSYWVNHYYGAIRVNR